MCYHTNVCVCVTSLRRNQVKSEYLMSLESSECLLEEIGAQALNAAAYQPPDAVIQAIDAVTQDAVVKVCDRYFPQELVGTKH